MERICRPEETFERVLPFLPKFGITRIGRHTGLDRIGIPVWCAYTPNSKSIVVAHGKGLTDAEAKTSATMEALERAVACEPALDVRYTSAAHLRALGANAEVLSPLVARGQLLIGEHEVIGYVAGEDLLTGEPVHVPLDAISLDRTIENCRYWQSSDGLASGNTYDEAVFHGLMERIERDAHVLWQVLPEQKQHLRCLDPRILGHRDIDRLVGMMDASDMRLRMFDLTSDIGVPCFAAFLTSAAALASPAPRYVDVTFGCGAALSPAHAAIRAITEAAQSRLTYISGARDDVFHEIYERTLPLRLRRLFDAAPSSCFGPQERPSSFDEVLHRLKLAGVRHVIAVRLSSDDLPFAVAKVVVPDLENPEGARRQRLGHRAISASLMA